MAIKIHHGANGAYKTSGAVWDDAVPAAKAGRLIITNIRGMSAERFERLFSDLPDSFDLMYINHETQEGMDKIRTWFQWAPRDAFLIFDEAQSLFPKSWTDKFLERFDYPGGLDAANTADRPFNFLDAWTRHRHWNWDVILTTPNIKYVHEQIRQTSEAAYEHRNLALLGNALKFIVQKDYKEAMHSAQENRAPNDGSTIVALRKIDKRVFKLSDSTATVQHLDTMTCKSAFASPRLLLLFGIGACAIYFAFKDGVRIPLSSSSTNKDSVAQAPAVRDTPKPVAADHDGDAKRVQSVPVEPSLIDPFGEFKITIKAGAFTSKGTLYIFELRRDDDVFQQSARDLAMAGYSIRGRSLCAADLIFEGQTRTVACSGAAQVAGDRAAKRLGSERQSSVASNESSVVVVPDSEYPARPWR
ncbi:zonular occludens toxin domain-containing protein [Pseudomonas sp. LRF_L74]|uniref:zonular occludens toxin domain-containing protein n=1 Tax=Pseudomonas sp. LRF_L74 TaxID=3369422 RepID=UPI003F5EBB13